MQPLLKPHPATVAFLLTGGAFVTFLGVYLLRNPNNVLSESGMNATLIWALMWGITFAGVAMWLAGGIVFGKRCGLGCFLSLFLHFLPVLGLIIAGILGKRRITRGVWTLKYRGVDDRIARRTHREMKALY